MRAEHAATPTPPSLRRCRDRNTRTDTSEARRDAQRPAFWVRSVILVGSALAVVLRRIVSRRLWWPRRPPPGVFLLLLRSSCRRAVCSKRWIIKVVVFAIVSRSGSLASACSRPIVESQRGLAAAVCSPHVSTLSTAAAMTLPHERSDAVLGSRC